MNDLQKCHFQLVRMENKSISKHIRNKYRMMFSQAFRIRIDIYMLVKHVYVKKKSLTTKVWDRNK